jgi:predicted ArsR family transcriptional regulator
LDFEEELLPEQHIAAMAALNEPARRALYLHVVHQGRDVTRDEAAQALGMARSVAAFHLDKLVEEGMLEAHYRRLTGRRGPGAGRPSKLYRRSRRQFEISLPPRSYELAAQLFARGLERSDSAPAVAAIQGVARSFGETLGTEARKLAGPRAHRQHLLDTAEILLNACGFEPHRGGDGAIRLRNCPFHTLASEHPDLVCGINLSMMQGVVDGLQMSGIEAVLDKVPDMCCVVFQQVKPAPKRSNHKTVIENEVA